MVWGVGFINTEYTDLRKTNPYPRNTKQQYSFGYLFAKIIHTTQIPGLVVKHIFINLLGKKISLILLYQTMGQTWKKKKKDNTSSSLVRNQSNYNMIDHYWGFRFPSFFKSFFYRQSPTHTSPISRAEEFQQFFQSWVLSRIFPLLFLRLRWLIRRALMLSLPGLWPSPKRRNSSW